MKVLVTGAAGFVGRYVLSELTKWQYQVFATVFRDERISEAIPVPLNIMDSNQTRAAVREIKPDAVVHLAAQSKVSASWNDPVAAIEINTIGTINLINGIKKHSPHAKVVVAGSSEEYGLAGKTGQILTEYSPCQPQNPYAVSKFAAGQISMQIARKHGLKLYYMRPFNHFGPGQPAGFMISDFCSQIAQIEQGLKEPCLKVGDLSAQRDFTHVTDVTKAYQAVLASNLDPGIYNICSGVTRSAREILDFLVSHSAVPIKISIDHERFRPSEVPIFYGSAEKLHESTGWHPTCNFYDSLIETLNWWRRQIAVRE
jgi:GDP-4-dehydro-6-deoxy-D-mannose reductase